KTVRESAEILGIIAGHDPLDSTSSARNIDDYTADLDAGIRGMRFGVITEAVEKLDGEVRANFDAALAVLRGCGAVVEDVSVPTFGYANEISYFIENAREIVN